MFSKLGGIFGTLPLRHVENADTRLEIRRDESRNQGKKKDSDAHDEYAPIPWEEISYVSIASLRTFLESVVTTEDSIAVPTPHVHEASNTLNQRAASAYQSVGRAVHDENVSAPAPPQSPTHIETNFSAEDLSRIKIFISDLIELQRRNVTELGMQRSENFLDSIEEAIRAAQAAL